MRYSSKEALIDDIRTAHGVLCARLRDVPKARCREPGVWGDGWTVSDLLAHLAEWHDMFLAWYDQGSRGITPRMPAPGFTWRETPRLNRAIWEKHRLRSPAAVRAHFDAGYHRILDLVEGLTADQLLVPGHFGWTGRYPLTTYLGPNTASHYRFATRVITRWLKGRAGTTAAECSRRPARPARARAGTGAKRVAAPRRRR